MTQTNRAEALLCVPLLLMGSVPFVAILLGLCAAITISVGMIHVSSVGIAALPGALHNAYFGGIQSGNVVLLVTLIALIVFAARGWLLAKPDSDAVVARLLPGLARPLRLAIASAWPMLLVVALPFGFVTLKAAVVWGVGLALLHRALWTTFGRSYPEPVTVKTGNGVRRKPVRELALLALVTVIVLLPFLNKPFHIDDPAYLWTAQQITVSPIDFYGFNLHMNGMRVPMHMEMQNPPLISYVLAPVALVTGWNEIPMHVVSLAFALAAVLGTYLLAQRFCVNAWAAALAMLSAPGFYLSATTVMCDVPMIAFYVWAAYAWLSGYDRSRHTLLAAAALLVALAALTKYFGMTMIPLLFVYSVVRSGGLRARQLHLLLPVAILAAYELWTRDYYGRGLLLGAGEYVRTIKHLTPEGLAPSWLVGAMFAGGSLGSIPLIGLASARTKTIAALTIGILLATAAAAFLLILLRPHVEALERLSDLNTGLGAFYAALSICVIALAAIDYIRNPGAESLLLGMWLAGSILFCVAANWSVTVRALLPAVVPAAILMVRQLETARGAFVVRKNAWKVFAASGCALALSMLIARGDTAFARFDRAMAYAVANVHQTMVSTTAKANGDPPTLWFDGRWGLEYYLKTYGGKTLFSEEVQVGDHVALPERADVEKLLPGRRHHTSHEIQIPRQGDFHTMFAGAGFYSSLFGPLPFAIGDAPVDRYRMYEILP